MTRQGMNWFSIPSPFEKIALLTGALSEAEKLTRGYSDFRLGRDIRVVSPAELPPKPGLSSHAGQGRLLHDLASIEMQAMELAVRTLYEFPDAPMEFRRELAAVALSEGEHLGMCLRGLESVGHAWGDWDVHLSLWNTVSKDDSLIDRVLIVHRYLEGSGLDAGDSILRRLIGVASKEVRNFVKRIVTEEVDHVLFGSRWYRKLCEEAKLDSEREFASRIGRIAALAPRRERVARDLRLRAGFTEFEIEALELHHPLKTTHPGA